MRPTSAPWRVLRSWSPKLTPWSNCRHTSLEAALNRPTWSTMKTVAMARQTKRKMVKRPKLPRGKGGKLPSRLIMLLYLAEPYMIKEMWGPRNDNSRANKNDWHWIQVEYSKESPEQWEEVYENIRWGQFLVEPFFPLTSTGRWEGTERRPLTQWAARELMMKMRNHKSEGFDIFYLPVRQNDVWFILCDPKWSWLDHDDPSKPSHRLTNGQTAKKHSMVMVSSKTIGNLQWSLQNHWNLQLLQE